MSCKCSVRPRAEPVENVRPHSKSFFQWVPTDEEQLLRAEARALQPLNGLYNQSMIGNINTVSTIDQSKPTTVVLLHGFAGGAATWVPNFAALAKFHNVHALDLPGFARSRRPIGSFSTPTEAMDFFMSELTEWFETANLRGPVHLVGHSFGGYLASRYAMHSPKHVARLVLVDPWGVPHYDPERYAKMPLRWKLVMKIFYAGSPLTVLRAAGPWGPSLLPKVRKDFSAKWSSVYPDPSVFYDYVFHSNAQSPATGENGFKALCHGPAYARFPLLEELPGTLDTQVPLRIIYGAETWMAPEKGYEMARLFQARGGDAEVSMVMGAGHHVYIDNAVDFNKQLLASLKE